MTLAPAPGPRQHHHKPRGRTAILAEGSPERRITLEEKKQYLAQIVEAIGIQPQRVLLLPPDITRFYSDAGLLTSLLYDMFSPTAEVDVMPTLGTHNPMTADEIRRIFGDNIPLERVLVHDWRRALVHLGDVPGDCVRERSEGKLNYDIRVEVNRRLVEESSDEWRVLEPGDPRRWHLRQTCFFGAPGLAAQLLPKVRLPGAGA